MKIGAGTPLPHRVLPSQRIEPAMPGPDGRHQLPEYDIIVIGGGINGTAIAMDAATRGKDANNGQGLKVLLLEKNDFGGGTSATSSRLIHGGLRYLKNVKTSLLSKHFNPRRALQEAGLVHESLQERERLLRNAPHLVRPLPSVLPVFDYNSEGMGSLKAGLTMYDALSHGKSMPNHRKLDRQAFAERYPQANPDGLKGGYLYYDAQANLPERICVENAVAARETGNATLINHAEVTGITTEDIKNANREATGVTFRDVLTGEEYAARGKVIVNAAGPWVDELLQKLPHVQAAPAKGTDASGVSGSDEVPSTGQRMGVSGSDEVPAIRQRMGGTKGSHIVVKKWPGGPDHGFYASAKSDGRPFFILPWRNDYYLIGTTDIRYDGDLDKITATRDEVRYLIEETNNVLPGAALEMDDVLYTTSGVRPLLHEPDKPEAEITRKHVIEDHGKASDVKTSRFVSIIGGKLTTARNLAEETVDAIVKEYGLRLPNGRKPCKSRTGEMSLPGGVGIDDIKQYKAQTVPVLSRAHGVSEEQVSRMIDLYGSRTSRVLAYAAQDPVLKSPLFPGSRTLGAEVVYAVREEMAVTLADVLLRRTGGGLDEDAGLKAAEPAARIMGRELGWDESRIRQEISDYTSLINATALAFRTES